MLTIGEIFQAGPYLRQNAPALRLNRACCIPPASGKKTATAITTSGSLRCSQKIEKLKRLRLSPLLYRLRRLPEAELARRLRRPQAPGPPGVDRGAEASAAWRKT